MNKLAISNRLLYDKEKVKVDFRPFIHVEGVDAKDVRQQKIDLKNYTAIILTSRNAVNHYHLSIFALLYNENIYLKCIKQYVSSVTYNFFKSNYFTEIN